MLFGETVADLNLIKIRACVLLAASRQSSDHSDKISWLIANLKEATPTDNGHLTLLTSDSDQTKFDLLNQNDLIFGLFNPHLRYLS